MKIKVENKEAEAYYLIMRKENALDILNGKKKVEIRDYTDHYCGHFFDKDKLDEFNKEVDDIDFEPTDKDGVLKIEKAIKKIKYARFTNRNNTWHLDVRLDWIYICSMTKDDVDFLSKEFGFDEYNDKWQEFEDKVEQGLFNEVPSFFALAIREVVSHEGLK